MYKKANRGAVELSVAHYKNPRSKRNVERSFFGMCLFFVGISAQAQCAMCRAALEGEGNIKKAEAVNDGIVYLMMIPYVLVAAIGFFIYRMYRKKKA